MNTPTPTPTAQALFTFQDVTGAFVDVIARAEYAGESLDVTRKDIDGAPAFVVSGTNTPRAAFRDMPAAWEAFTAQRLARLAAKFGTFEVAK